MRRSSAAESVCVCVSCLSVLDFLGGVMLHLLLLLLLLVVVLLPLLLLSYTHLSGQYNATELVEAAQLRCSVSTVQRQQTQAAAAVQESCCTWKF